MRDLHAFFDRDICIKLACCDIWDEVLEKLGVTHPYRLASATAVGSKIALKRMGCSDEHQNEIMRRLAKISSRVPTLPEEWINSESNVGLYNQLIQTDGIDSGEAQLILASLACEYNNKLVTGDKRFIEAMSKNFPAEFQNMRGTLITFERCLLSICCEKEFDTIRSRLISGKMCDGSLRLALGIDNSANYEQFKEALLSFDPLRS